MANVNNDDKQERVSPKSDTKTVTQTNSAKAVSQKEAGKAATQEKSQDFSKFAQGPRTSTHGQGTVRKSAKSSGQFGQEATPLSKEGSAQFGQTGTPKSEKERGQFGQTVVPGSAPGRGQFGQTTPTPAAGRGQFGQELARGLGRGQFKQVAPSEMHSQSLGQRQEETIRRAHQQRFAADSKAMRFRIIAASIAGVLVIGLILGIVLIIGSPDNRVVLSIDINTDNAKKSYYIGEAFDATGLKLSVNYTDGTQEVLDVKPEWVSAGTQLDTSRRFVVASPSGKQTSLVVTYKGIPKSFEVYVSRETVLGPTSISEITAVRLTKSIYDFEETLALNNAEIDYKMRNGLTGSVKIKQDEASRTNLDRFGPGLNWDWKSKDFSSVSGDRTVTIMHKDGAEFSINVFVRGNNETVDKIKVTRDPMFSTYKVGQTLQTWDMEVQAIMKDKGATTTILNRNQFTVSPTVLHDAGDKIPIDVIYIAASGARLTTTFNVCVTTSLKSNWNPATGSEFPVGNPDRGLEVKAAPQKKVYSVWEPIEIINGVVPGFTLTARHAGTDGKPDWEETIPVTRAMIISADLDYAGRFTSIGTKVLTIRYMGRTVTQSFIVTDGVRSLRALGNTKDFYQVGDYLGRMEIEVIYNGIDKLTGLNRQERFSFAGLADALENGFEVYCTAGGFNVATDNFSQPGWTQLTLTYGGAGLEIWLTVVEEYDISRITVGSVTELSLNDVLDISKIRVDAYRVGVNTDYPDGQTVDIVMADKLRGITIESVKGMSGMDVNDLTGEIFYGAGYASSKLTFDANKGPNNDGFGLRYIKVTYKGESSIFVINII